MQRWIRIGLVFSHTLTYCRGILRASYYEPGWRPFDLMGRWIAK